MSGIADSQALQQFWKSVEMPLQSCLVPRETGGWDEVASGWISSVRSWLSLPADGTLPSGGPLISWLPVELLTFDQPEVATFHFQTLSPGPFVYHHSSLT